MVDDVLRSLAAPSGVNQHIMQRINDFRVAEELVMAGSESHCCRVTYSPRET